MTRQIRALALGAVVLLAIVPACDVSSPERIIRAPVIREFKPETESFDVTTRDTVSFSISAVDPDEEELRFSFSLDDSVVAAGPSWTYVVEDTGLTEVTGRVFNRASYSEVKWRLNRLPAVNEPPIIVSFVPIESRPSVIIGNTVEFSVTASDPEGGAISYVFTVDGALVAASNRYNFQAKELGDFNVKAVASDGESFVSHEWALSVQAEPDSTAPGPVTLTSLVTGAETGELVVEWIAVGDDGDQGLPTNYVVRTSRVTIDSDAAWDQASDRPGEPDPEMPGTLQQMVIPFLPPAEEVWVAIRAVDDFGNLSPIGNTLSAMVKGNDVTGIVRDALTGDPAPGIRVALAGDMDVTDVDGHYALSHLPNATGPIEVNDETDPQVVGAYYAIRVNNYTIQDEDVRDFWIIPNVPLETTDYPSFLNFMVLMTTTGTQFGDLIRTWDTPFDVYVPPFQTNGVDYEAVIRQALTEWEDVTGLELFEFVDAQPDTGVYFRYDGTVSRDVYRTIVSDSRQLPILGEITIRTVYYPEVVDLLDTVAGHEFGHALGLFHSSDELHIMVGNQVPRATQPSADEISLIRVLYHLPRGQSTLWFLDD